MAEGTQQQPFVWRIVSAAAESARSYLTCRFTRFLILLHKPSQNTTRQVYRFVPTQEWSGTWSDETLYQRYHLSSPEIDFIERIVRPMEVAVGESDG